ncbi:hypothetical protein [Halalkalicoccus salilacus]|uniref:hypothetical protein n=1 Tax=Halalkalicoccus sp. GCM10025704 TaxID=3252662 RepID=UPI0036237730
MDEISLAVPRELAETLPEDSDEVLVAMQRELDQYEGYVNGAIAEGESEERAPRRTSSTGSRSAGSRTTNTSSSCAPGASRRSTPRSGVTSSTR